MGYSKWNLKFLNMKNEYTFISVVIPIYNVASFIARCAGFLFNQSMRDGIEFIFVDDATPDNSMDILQHCLEQYPERKGQTTILKHEKNLGLPAARNTGMKVAKGEYVFHCDSDDFLEPDALEVMYKVAKAQDADIVWCDWLLTFGKNERYMRQPYYATAYDALKGILNGKMKYNVWNKLVRRQLYVDNDICFPSGHGMGEDMTMVRLFACANKVACVPRAFYHYVKLNGEAFTNTFSEKHLKDVLFNVNQTVDFLYEKFGKTLESEVLTFKLNVKYPFLISDDFSMYRLWKEWFPEASKAISNTASWSLRSRILQWAAFRRQYWLLWLHYKLVYKFVYGVIYK